MTDSSDFGVIQDEAKQEAEDKRLLYEISEGEKLFTYTKKVHDFDAEIVIKQPTISQRHRSEMEYSKVFNRLLQDKDQLTNSQLLDLAKDRGIFSEKEQEELVGLEPEISEFKERISSESVDKKKDKLQKELDSLREKKFRLAVRIGNITSTSIENLAESAKLWYLVELCLFDSSSGKLVPLYENKEALDNEKDFNKLQRILYDARSMWFGEGLSDFLQLDD